MPGAETTVPRDSGGAGLRPSEAFCQPGLESAVRGWRLELREAFNEAEGESCNSWRTFREADSRVVCDAVASVHQTSLRPPSNELLASAAAVACGLAAANSRSVVTSMQE